MFMGMGGRGGEPSELAKASQALTAVLQNKEAGAGEIKAALQALRDARAKAKAELEKAQKELKEILTLRQEAQLVQMGVLD
jgi:Spy/CpxP family protein refolding chaperone